MQTVLTTGANSGLGLATAIEMARKGYRSIGSARTEVKADVIRRAAADAGVTVETVLLDVDDAARCATVIGEIGPLHGLVNNAGFSQTGAVEDVGDDEVRAILETMLVAPMRLARLALPGMRSLQGGCIINISSIYGRTTTPFTGWYQAAKHGLEGVTDALRMEVAKDGIKVVLIEPGGFKTAIFDEVERDLARRAGSRYDAAYKRSAQAVRMAAPLMGDPKRVARLVARVMGTNNPRARYLVGYDAQVAAVTSQFTPTMVKDLATRLGLGL